MRIRTMLANLFARRGNNCGDGPERDHRGLARHAGESWAEDAGLTRDEAHRKQEERRLQQIALWSILNRRAD